MGLYKYSQFNLIAKEETDRLLLYNTYSLNYRWIEKSELDDIKDKFNIDLGDVPEYFAHEGFIVPMEIDEIQRLKDDAQEQLKRADYMFLSIFTTLACNYRCVYCFEKDQLCQTEYLSKETADNIISFIKRRYAEHQFTKPLKIKWFGGESLLNMEIIRYISKELRSNKIEYSAKLYTNGRLLTRELALELKELGVTDEVVIPIDGLASTYAHLKACKEEDFYAVLDNIKACEDVLKIIIHINISEASKDDVKELISVIRNKYNIKSAIKVKPIAPINTKIITKENSVDFDDFHNNIELANKNKKKYIVRRWLGCEARYKNFYVIGTKGEIYICEYTIGKEKYIVGNVREQQNIINRNNTIWDINKIIDDCNKCKILPICLGYCTSQRYLDNIDCQMDKNIDAIKQLLCKLAYTKQE